jgi:16S rRNA G966 N2-methylase RsmD
MEFNLLAEQLKSALLTESIHVLKVRMKELLLDCSNTKDPHILYARSELQQILEAQTLERSKYYINRLINALTQEKKGAINDLNLNRWKQYSDIVTDSLWLFDKRDRAGAHHAGYWGNFIPQIPNQMLRRYTRKGDWVLDAFAGSGTTLIESRRLGRNSIGIEIDAGVKEMADASLAKETNPYNTQSIIFQGDSAEANIPSFLHTCNCKSIQLLMLHPPYWDIIKFTELPGDLSNAATIDDFLLMMKKVIDNTWPVLDKKRYCALVIGDKYDRGRWIPLGFNTMQLFLDKGYILKSIIVKNFEDTRAKMSQKELWRYRALVGGFYVFKHEYIFLFQKP